MSINNTGDIQSNLQAILETLTGHASNLVNGALGQATNLINQQLGNLIGSLQNLLNGKRAVQLQNLTNIITQVQNVVSALPNQISSVLNNFLAQGLQFLTSLQKPQARELFVAAGENAKNAIQDLLNQALEHLQSIGTSLANIGLASVLNVLQGKRGLFDSLGSIFNNIGSVLGTHVDNITSSLSQVGQQLLGAVSPHIQDLQDQLIQHGLNAAQSLLGTLANISGTLQGKRGIFDDLLAQVNNVIGNLGSTLSQVGSGIVSAVTPHLQDLQDQLTNHALNAAQSLLGTLANISGTLQG